MDPETGRIKLGWELMAGGMAGGCQVVCLLFLMTVFMLPTTMADLYQSPGNCVSLNTLS